MNIIKTIGTDNVAFVHIAQFDNNPKHIVEFVDATDNGIPRTQKWVINVSTQFGCPVQCMMCDAGSHYFGNVTSKQMLQQIGHVIKSQGHTEKVPTKKFKVHFSRMGEPALNDNVLEAVTQLKGKYETENLIPAIATIAPKGTEQFFSKLKTIKDTIYPGGHFQLQFSINSTDEEFRNMLMPFPKLTMKEIAELGKTFFEPGDRKLVLNLAVAEGTPVDPKVISNIFNPEMFMIKLTPLNPTEASRKSGFQTSVSADIPDGVDHLAKEMETAGFDVIVSIGSPLEDEIGSNCGEAVLDWREHLTQI